MTPAVLPARLPMTSHDLSQRLRGDAAFDMRWAAWQSRGRSHERAVRRRLLMVLPLVALGVTIVWLLLLRQA